MKTYLGLEFKIPDPATIHIGMKIRTIGYDFLSPWAQSGLKLWGGTEYTVNFYEIYTSMVTGEKTAQVGLQEVCDKEGHDPGNDLATLDICNFEIAYIKSFPVKINLL